MLQDSGTDGDLASYIASLSPRLSLRPDGVWTSGATETVSYPDEGHEACAEVEPTSYWFAHRNRCIVALVRRFAPAGPILDVGGGNGAVSQALTAARIACIVVEPGAHGAATARSRGLPVIQATFRSADIVDGSVRAIGLFDVLEHIEDEAGTLAALHRSLGDGGWLYMTVPAFGWLWSDSDNTAGHVRRYSVRSACRALRRAGFEIAFATYMFGALVPPIFVLRSLPSLFGRRRGLKRPATADRALGDNVLGRGIGRALEAEASRIERGKTVPFGSSVLVAARKR